MTSNRNVQKEQKIYILIRISAFLVLLFQFSLPSEAADSLEILFFYESGCPHCARINDFLNKRINPNYPVVVRKYDIYKPENVDLLFRLADVYNAKGVTPTVFVGDTFIQEDNRKALNKLEEVIRSALRVQAPSPLSLLREEKEGIKKRLTLPAVIGAAAVDAINPCACAVLTLLLGTILLSSRRRNRVLGAGFAFTSSTFISYFLMGFGLFSAIQMVGIQHYVYIGVALIAILVGLGNMKDYLWYGKWFKMEVPESWRPKLKQITSGVSSIPGAFSIGFLVSLFLLPCTSGPYIVIIGMLSDSSTRMQAVWLLLLYNLIFILPFVIITLVVGFGFASTGRVEAWRKKRLEKLHLATGLVMFALGITMITLVIVGTI